LSALALPPKRGIKIAILGSVFSALLFLVVHFFVHWALIDYKPNIKGSSYRASIVEAEAYSTNLPVKEVIRKELDKVDHDPVLAITCLLTGFWLAYVICNYGSWVHSEQHKKEL